MPELDKTVATSVSFTDLLLAGGTKFVIEKAATPFIGNGTLKSGVIKLGAVYLAGNKMPEFLRMAVAIDGTEDIAFAVLSMIGMIGGAPGGAAEEQSILV